ncbi:76cf2e27-b6d9-4c8b-b3e8-449205199587 [Thermothielavioides terrestris]|uniref:Uncharacterized protein n=2 Tax=Thermothielavioides terrestris TaxID=2587410 RepID=G2R892_THETT|nr:uncharacterized protein THITE_2170692 [Thermothielavioides terrestris NRRL 8126]AEO68151.1 hypothetical protein THITE_2170692 [Thermothielavioides terrestris NRRL 8126]SPQ24602.1 76cf2e27-b6d9-4c8b-b3e8-449205199587 [Thermothielavioides terrestris]
MSRSMSWLRLSSIPLGHGIKPGLQGRFSVVVSGFSGSTTSSVALATTSQGPQTTSVRPFSAGRPAKSSGRTSRFQRSSASPVGTPANAANKETQSSPSLSTAGVSEPLPVSKPAAVRGPVAAAASTRPVSRPQGYPQGRKPVDTSSKEYKQTERRVVRLLVALPFLIVTSYYLYRRLADHLSQHLPGAPRRAPEQPGQRS